jgi:excisionase family DNA binding protein
MALDLSPQTVNNYWAVIAAFFGYAVRRELVEKNPVMAIEKTKQELASFFGISERFIELEVNRGRLRAVRFSNRLLRFRPIDVHRWMESSLTAAAEPDETKIRQ